ncbi:hypothetical protein AYJ08_13970 [Brevibacillus sp. SKDU10]|uniref:hypothetical protein n=1 Tax=Brevibacillus sp. SKDU10 TaxID=1247872 RepID=UPI0007C904BA|nr:hypothetical protein [Brevibacillus sp. SKDU10]OAJ73535.1 hypothetical protein AYJ08_13970 [Brevibacillus sp. SKDU10]
MTLSIGELKEQIQVAGDKSAIVTRLDMQALKTAIESKQGKVVNALSLQTIKDGISTMIFEADLYFASERTTHDGINYIGKTKLNKLGESVKLREYTPAQMSFLLNQGPITFDSTLQYFYMQGNKFDLTGQLIANIGQRSDIDSLDNVYTANSKYPSGPPYESILTVKKYTRNLNLLWEKTITLKFSIHEPDRIWVNDSFVVIQCDRTELVFLDTDGNYLYSDRRGSGYWTTYYNVLSKKVVDAGGKKETYFYRNLLDGGDFSSDTTWRYQVTDTKITPIWQKKYGTRVDDYGQWAVDDSKDICYMTRIIGTTTYGYELCKYGSDGQILATAKNLRAASICIGKDGFLYALGEDKLMKIDSSLKVMSEGLILQRSSHSSIAIAE